MRQRILVASVLASLVMALAACGGGGGGSGTTPPSGGGGGPTPPPAAGASTRITSTTEASRFLHQATFGPRPADITSLNGQKAEDWLRAEFAKPAQPILPALLLLRAPDGTLNGRPHSDIIYTNMLRADDQLRQRMIFALSQIWVVSDSDMFGKSLQFAYFHDVLAAHAFGNYRTLMEEVTYSPAMAEYLTYLRNRKGDPRTGRMPDENYARELLQLFTIGLVELNMDGTPKTGPSGQIETYNNSDIEGLANVFTGLSTKGNFWTAAPDGYYSRLVMYPAEHSTLAKSFLGTTIPANTAGDDSIRQALDRIFAHPNLAPFVSRQLIQRFTASNPSPAYVSRVAQAFETGRFRAPDGSTFGTGQRGDLQATLAAILLDPTVHQDPATLPNDAGKIREPVLKFTALVRAFNMAPASAGLESRLSDTSSPVDRLAMHPFRSPSVFNFYRPGFILPNSVSGGANLTAPEFQLITEGTSIGYINFMTDYVFDRTPSQNNVPSFVPDYSVEAGIANDATALVERLNMLMTAGQMTDAEKAAAIAAVNALPITEADAANDRLKRVQAAILVIASQPAYAVIR